MGKASYDIAVTFDKRVYLRGETLHGRVALHVRKPLNCVELSSVLICQERYEHNDVDSGWHRHVHDLYFRQAVVEGFGPMLPVGEHNFSLTWTIPFDWPRQFELSNTRSVNCVGVHVLIDKKVLKRHLSSFSVDTDDMPLPPLPTAKSVTAECEHTIKRWGIFRSGVCKIVAQLDSDVLEVATTPSQVTVQLIKTERLDFDNLKVSLNQSISENTPSVRWTRSWPVRSWTPSDPIMSTPNDSVHQVVRVIPLDGIGRTSESIETRFMKVSYFLNVSCTLKNASTVSLSIPVHVARWSSAW